MKIAVFHNLPSGGAKRALFGNISYLTTNHNIDVFVPSTANEQYLPLNEVVDNLKVFPVNNSTISYLFSALKYFPSKVSLRSLEMVQKEIAENINDGDYDVVLCDQDRYTMAPFLLKYIKKPHIYYCAQPIIYRNKISLSLYNKTGLKLKNASEIFRFKIYGKRMTNLDRKIVNFSKYTIANSYFSHESIMRTYGINSYVSYLGVDTDLFKPMNIPKENFVLSVGQCLPEKGFEFILKSLSKIDEKKRPEFFIVSDQGNINWQNYLIKLSSQLRVKLRILNMISDSELVMLYNKAKLVVYAPYLEPFGLVPLESMSCGTPVVGVKEGGVRESVIHNKTGILTERDENIFANAVSELFSDDKRRKILGKNSNKYVNNNWTLKDSGNRIYYHLNRAFDKFNDIELNN